MIFSLIEANEKEVVVVVVDLLYCTKRGAVTPHNKTIYLMLGRSLYRMHREVESRNGRALR